MNRAIAREVHRTTNISSWLENSDWNPGGLVFGTACFIARTLPFSIHDFQKRMLFKTDGLVAVNGESVVVANGTDKVDKFMFRYPGKMSTEDFRGETFHEIATVTHFLAGVALPTQVSVKHADIFRYGNPLSTVTQTQERLDLVEHQAANIPALANEPTSPWLDRTARDIEQLVTGADEMARQEGLYPDLAASSGNVRISQTTGAVSLIDVMPIYQTGGRLIGSTANILDSTLATIEEYKDFVGQYGS